MTLLKEFLDTKFNKFDGWCDPARQLLRVSTADMYNGTNRPDYWAQVLAYTNLAKAKFMIASLINDYGDSLDAGTLKTKMTSFTDSMTTQEYSDLIAWAEPLRRGTDKPKLHGALYAAALFIKSEDKDFIRKSIEYLIRYDVETWGFTLEAAIAAMYTKLRALVTLEEWRGSYE